MGNMSKETFNNAQKLGIEIMKKVIESQRLVPDVEQIARMNTMEAAGQPVGEINEPYNTIYWSAMVDSCWNHALAIGILLGMNIDYFEQKESKKWADDAMKYLTGF